MTILAAALLVAFAIQPARAFDPPVAIAGNAKLEILPFADVRRLETELPLDVRITNSGASALHGVVRVAVIDDWRIAGASESRISAEPGQQAVHRFTVVAGGASHAALYPVHAWFTPDGAKEPLHAIAIVSVLPEAIPSRTSGRAGPALLSARQGRQLPLEQIASASVWLRVQEGGERKLAPGFAGADQATGAVAERTTVSRPDSLPAIGVHPPWRSGWGEIGLDYSIALPDTTPIAFTFATAIRDSHPGEPLSDGVEFVVLASGGGEFRELFRRFSASKAWEPAEVDLSAFRGNTVSLRLLTGPGPENDTTCDHAFWGQPTIAAGQPASQSSTESFADRAAKALDFARRAMAGDAGPLAWQLQTEDERCGAAIVPGPAGIVDAAIALVGATGDLVLSGLRVDVDGDSLGGIRSGLDWTRGWQREVEGRAFFPYQVTPPGQPSAVEASVEVFAEGGALRFRLAMPGTKRDLRGGPRFTAFGVGPGSRKALRVYAGFGNVVEDPQPFDLSAGGFTLSTSHVGADYEGGLSVVQATDVFPDVFSVHPNSRHYTLMTHHDATLSLVPSSRGAFCAARVYREHLADFRPAPAVDYLKGRMCLDSWHADDAAEEREINLCKAYGMTDAVFVKHNWQRWGYDYRLPDIFPPQGGLQGFRALAEACRDAGINFVPHDNYIDIYPDADGYSYEHVWFNEDGTPQLGWWNPGRKAQSYHFSPNAFKPFLQRNRDLLARHVRPGGVFVDVFTAYPPMDFYDHEGRFFTKDVCAKRWSECFDEYRKGLGKDGVTVSEAGCDSLIGHLDAGESDHGAAFATSFGWAVRGADAERVPWHDMASHGAFILFAGGLGNRYSGGEEDSLHGYGSDDYLSLTVLGGRNPMCDGPFSRRALMTYWLLHDVCAGLARQPILAHEFDGSIHRQRVSFGEGGSAVVNRASETWETGGVLLPQYGFSARCGDAYADVRLRDGIITAFATSPAGVFVDARTQSHTMNADGAVGVSVTGVEDLGSRRFRLRIRWEVVTPVATGMRPFLHFDRPGAPTETIAFQGDGALRGGWSAPGVFDESVELSVPADASDGEYPIRFGFWDPANGRRTPMRGRVDSAQRATAGLLALENGRVSWRQESDPLAPRLNTARKMVDFGPVATNGAFRVTGEGAHRVLTPLPGSDGFDVSMPLPEGFSGASAEVSALDGAGRRMLAVSVRSGSAVFTVPAGAGRCAVAFR